MKDSRVAIESALAQAGVSPDEVSEVILGQVLTAAQGQNPARQAAMAAGVPKEIPSWGINQVCGSGLRAVAVAAQSIIAGDARIVVAGGQESMSLSPHAQHLRNGARMGDLDLVDTMIKGAPYFDAMGSTYVVQIPFGLLLSAVAIWTPDRRFQLAFVVLHLLYQAWSIAFYFETYG